MRASNPRPEHLPTRYPVVLVNGFDVSPLFRYAPRITDMMESIGGHQVFLAIDTPYAPPQRRARDLWERVRSIRSQTGAEKVNLVCHSLGGLDCRFLVSPAGLHWEVDAAHTEIVESVASITTIGTAHRGTRVADAALGAIPEAEAEEALNRLADSIGEGFAGEPLDGVDLRASLAAISTSEALAFNAQILDAEGVYYQSWAGFSAPAGRVEAGYLETLHEWCRADDGSDGLEHFFGVHDYLALPLIPSADLAGTVDGQEAFVPNDGLVPVSATHWGVFRGCIPADHMEQLGQRNIPDVNVRTGFDVARFYTNLAGDLSRRGF
ncbi:MAG: hypothetical protein KDC14_13385 [Planctomycetes bacterium]|nr:hypothetical protein [Planctomycetota bacterium]